MSEGSEAVGAVRRVFHARRGLAWGQVLLGWVCAQGLLTLLPIAPPGWGPPFLIATGGGFAVCAALGLVRALSARPMLEVAPEGIRAGGREIPWAAVRSWRAVPQERRLALVIEPRALPEGGPISGLMLRLRGTLAFDARGIDARLTDIVRAFRDIRPDLENPE